MNIFKMYEEQKVPWVHRLPEIIPDERVHPCEVISARACDKEWILTVRLSNSREYRVSLSFPKLGGIRIKDKKGGYFTADAAAVTYKDVADGRKAAAPNGYSAVLKNGGFLIELCRDDKVFYRIDENSIELGIKNGEYRKAALITPINTDERFFGFGEKYNALNQVGHVLPLWNDDTGYHGHTEAGDKVRSYKNVPLFHSSNGYTVFYNSFYGAFADLTERENTRFRLEFNSPLLDVYFWQGSPGDTMNCYTALTGRPVLPPKWAFEFWAGGTGENWNCRGKENFVTVFKEAVDGYKAMGTLPAAIYGEAAPSQCLVCHEIAQQAGMRMLAWNHPGVDAFIRGYDVKRIREIFPGIKDGDIPMLRSPESGEIIDKTQFYIDYSHPKAYDLIYNKYDLLWNWGLKGAMVDFGEFVECDTAAYNGMKGDEMHNYHAYCYSKTVSEAWRSRNGDDYVLFARAACAGTQKWVSFFGGDQRGEFYGLRQAYYGGLNAGLSGFTVWGSDIGSLCECGSAELYIRWLQFAAFSPLMRTHGNHNPWNYGDECVRIFKKFFWFRKNIIDYIYSAALQSNLTGRAIIRTMADAYPNDKSLSASDDQFMLGDSLLVCPVLYEGMKKRSVILPQGGWLYLPDMKMYAGGESAEVETPIDICPVFVKAGSVIPVNVSENSELAKPINGGVEALLTVPGNGDSVFYNSERKRFNFTVSEIGEKDGYVIYNRDGYSVRNLKIAGRVTEAFADGKRQRVIPNGKFSDIVLDSDIWEELKIKC